MSSTLDIATEGLLQQEAQAPGCRPVVVVRQDQTLIVKGGSAAPTVTPSAAPNINVSADGGKKVASLAAARAAVVKEPQTDVTVAGMTCIGGGGSGGTDESSLFTPSLENGYLYPLRAGQVVCIKSGKFQPATSEIGYYEAVGLVIDSLILAGGFGRAQTTGLIELTTGQWDLVTTHMGGLVPEAPYYLHTSGKLSPDVPATGVLVRVGLAITSTQFSIDIEPPVLL